MSNQVNRKNSLAYYQLTINKRINSGSENSNVVLLLHGFPDCWISWRYQITALSQYYRVIALDLKGFNDSEKPTWRHEYKPKVICEELEQLIQALGVTSVTLIGHDLGALIG
jgi:epoxide hydrolase 4